MVVYTKNGESIRIAFRPELPKLAPTIQDPILPPAPVIKPNPILQNILRVLQKILESRLTGELVYCIPAYFILRSAALSLFKKRPKNTILLDETDVRSGYIARDFRPGIRLFEPLPFMGRLSELMICLERVHPAMKLFGYRSMDGETISKNFSWENTTTLRKIVKGISLYFQVFVSEDVKAKNKDDYYVSPHRDIPNDHFDPQSQIPDYGVVIMMPNCLYNLLVILGAFKTKLTVIHLHPDMTQEEIRKALKGIRVRIAFVASSRLELFQNLKNKYLKKIVSATTGATECGIPIASWKDFLVECRNMNPDGISYRPHGDQLAIVSYTVNPRDQSGCKGQPPPSEPRVVQITHDKLTDNVADIISRAPPLPKKGVYLAHLPLSQIDHLSMIVAFLSFGIRVAISSPETLYGYDPLPANQTTTHGYKPPALENSAETRVEGDVNCIDPTYLVTRTTDLYKIYRDIALPMLQERSWIYRKCFNLAVWWNAILTRWNLPSAYPWERWLLAPNRKYFSSKLKYILCSGEILAPAMQNFFIGLYGINVVQYYVSQESGYIGLMQDWKDYSVDNVGYPFLRTRIKFGELGAESPLNKLPSGLLRIATPENCLYHYSTNPEDQMECGKRLWDYTMDVAQLRPDGNVTILEYGASQRFLGRSNSKPPLAWLEAIYRSSLYVENVVLFIPTKKPGMVAYVSAYNKAIKYLAENLGINYDVLKLRKDERIKKIVRKELNIVAKQNGVSKKYLLSDVLIGKKWPVNYMDHLDRLRIMLNAVYEKQQSET